MLPAQYQWLAKEQGPRMVVEALKLHGTLETAGSKDNPTILSWAKEVGLSKTYSHDSIPWCGLFMAVIAHRADKPLPHSPLWALDWADWGVGQKAPMLGDVLVFKREGGGHVTLYVGEDPTAYHCLGGNQSDMVCITRIAKGRLYAARRPKYMKQPDNVRKIVLKANGGLSVNEK
jgi:uncharacterized protein (TIGR02594 family)